MTTGQQVWTDLQHHGFGLPHLQLLHTLVASGRNGSWSVHVVAGRVVNVDMRLVVPGRVAEMIRLEDLVSEAFQEETS